ncbi:MAG: LuxR family transcriptional regulator [Devosia sp. 67-54]|uniref:TatD family hydrolase n=1 Tax=unclassified Devosia TaxID=196773 RepID=UPI00095E7EAB|nr:MULTISPECIES: TatD family hydrolase [unclassified Devosia]MBN9304370.1 TatD family hydrolase [Devosia sp.]OJX18171.1 MAG: LuxR family transcriptional regulator [Devosia sp. 67-54]
MLIDSHCHLDFPELAADRAGVLARAKANGVDGVVTISTRVKQFAQLRAITSEDVTVWCSVGTHPHHAHEELDITTDDLVRLAETPCCVAIGEVGLDYHYEGDPVAQATGFRRHIAASRITRLPLVIHARDADDDVAAILEEEMEKGAFPFVLHCFSSGMDLARRGLALGGYISFSGILTFKNAPIIHDVAKLAPADRILVETDAPYLAPVPHRGRTNEPGFVLHTAEKLAELRGVPLDEIGRVTTENFYRLFSKAKPA